MHVSNTGVNPKPALVNMPRADCTVRLLGGERNDDENFQEDLGLAQVTWISRTP